MIERFSAQLPQLTDVNLGPAARPGAVQQALPHVTADGPAGTAVAARSCGSMGNRRGGSATAPWLRRRSPQAGGGKQDAAARLLTRAAPPAWTGITAHPHGCPGALPRRTP
jgi:hypothetical protein